MSVGETGKTVYTNSMKLLVIGASRGTGFEVVKAALAVGHIVTALSRSGSDALLADPNLTWVQADATDRKQLIKAMHDQHAVIVALGMSMAQIKQQPTLFSDSATATIEAMRQTQLRKVVVLSAYGTNESYDATNVLIRMMIASILKVPFKDHALQENYFRDEESIDWVIVRPSGLRPGRLSRTYKVRTASTKVPLMISRASVADFMVHACETNEYDNQAVSIGGS